MACIFSTEKTGPDRGRTAALLLLALGLGALLMAPLAAPLMLDQFGRSGPEAVAIEEPDQGVTDLSLMSLPPDLYRACGMRFLTRSLIRSGSHTTASAASAYYVPFIGLVTLALALYGLWRQWSQTWFWLLVALGIMIMALGPQLVGKRPAFPAVPMPYRAIADSLLDALIRRPHRLNNFLGLPVAMIASWGMVDLLSRIQNRWGAGRGTWYAAVTTLPWAP